MKVVILYGRHHNGKKYQLNRGVIKISIEHLPNNPPTSCNLSCRLVQGIGEAGDSKTLDCDSMYFPERAVQLALSSSRTYLVFEILIIFASELQTVIFNCTLESLEILKGKNGLGQPPDFAPK